MALVEGGRYGLSSFSSASAPPLQNKTVLFVKLTDSAIRAIEEHLRTQQKTGQNATLQFLGNEGRINIPSAHSSQGQTFDFSLQSNADIEGPQGSFECIQQSSSRSLESMGTLPFKMRIKANDDVYEETRQRFIQAEDIRKQERAKEIKPNGHDIGRKVKKKMDRIPHPLARREPSPFSHSKFSPSNNSSPIPNGKSPLIGSTNRNVNGTHPDSLTLNGNSRPTGGGKPATGPSDIAKRPLKERLIHLLAIKPFKKPELLARLSRDGIKEKEKPLVMPILKQMSTFKNNEYVLLRGVWNDVQEDWPCFTEMERQLMKRRKPQNLTPPGSDSSVSSGVSGCSGLSPRSTASNSSGGHTSPQHQQIGPYSSSHFRTKSVSSGNRGGGAGSQNMGGGVKRPLPTESLVGPDGLLEDNDMLCGSSSKKARVSHFKRPVRSSHGPGSGLSPNLSQSRVADRLSPIGSINTSGNSNYLSVPSHSSGYGHNHSPMGEHSTSSPFYDNGGSNHHSPRDPFRPEEYNGGYSPYSWNPKANDIPNAQAMAMDSDETDSIDSGNGSSTSVSGRHYNRNDDIGFGNVVSFHNEPLSHNKVPNNEPDFDQEGGGPSTEAFFSGGHGVSVPSTNGGSSGYQLSSPSSLEDLNGGSGSLHQKEKGCDYKTRQLFGDVIGQEVLVPSTKSASASGSDKEARSDKGRSSSRDKDKEVRHADRDRERNSRRDTHDDRKSSSSRRNKNESEGSSSKAADVTSYLSQYTRIQTEEQRSRYKDDFNNDYPLYRDLHAVIEKVSKKFAQLEERLREKVRGSEEYQIIRDQIVKEYHVSKKDRKYQEARERFNHLHKKLNHIKELVADYDRHTLNNQSSPAR